MEKLLKALESNKIANEICEERILLKNKEISLLEKRARGLQEQLTLAVNALVESKEEPHLKTQEGKYGMLIVVVK
jgi:hypothetical protein